jgi:enterochelin esterase family protein
MPTTQQWLTRAEQLGTPFINGDEVTFVWFGSYAPILMGDFNLWGLGNTPYPTLEQSAPNVWTHTITVPPRTYMEYSFTRDAEDSDARLLDPFNRRLVNNGFNRFNGSFATSDFVFAPLPKRTKRLAGAIGKFKISHPFLLHGKRDVWLYQPPTDQPVPLLVAYDGHDYIHKAQLHRLVDTLIVQGKIQPIALACIQNAEEDRLPEYAMSEALLMALLHEVLPLAQEHLHLLDPKHHHGAYAAMGASLGGLMAMYTGVRLPHIFGKVISQSGAYQIALDEQAPLLLRSLWKDPKPLNIWQEVGRYEWLHQTNEEIHAELVRYGYDVTYRVFNSGHNWTAWGATLPEALTTMFG